MPLALRLHTPTKGMRTTCFRSSRFLISSPLLYCFSYYCALQFCCKVLGVVAGLEPATNGVNDISSLYALPLSYTTHRIYIPSYKQLAATPAYGNNRRAHPHYWTCNQDSVFQFVLYVAVARQPYSAFNSHNLPSDLRYYLPALLFTSRPTRGHCWFGNYLVTSGCTYGLVTVSFHSISFEVYFAAVSAQGFARASPPFGGSRCHHRYGLLATHLAIVYSVYSAYLPGLPLRVPRRLWKVKDLNLRCFFLPSLFALGAFVHSANLPLFFHFLCVLARLYLNNFKSSYTPLRRFSAISIFA